MKQDFLHSSAPFYAMLFMLVWILGERVVAWKMKAHIGSWRETLGNIQCGLGQILLEIPFKALLILPYILIEDRFSLFQIPSNVWVLIGSFILTDALHYWYHRLHHESSLLWKIHLVHHQPEEFNTSVGLRLPWLHKLTVFPFYLAQAILGVPVEIFVVTVSFHAVLQLWNHTELIKGHWGFLNYFIVTPSHHRVHHGKNPQYVNRNYAAIFSVWDYIFGTFTPEKEKVAYGIVQHIQTMNLYHSNFNMVNKLKSLSPLPNKEHFLAVLSITVGMLVMYLATGQHGEWMYGLILVFFVLLFPLPKI